MTNASTASGRESFDVRAWVRAAGEGDAARVESLLAAGADVNAALESGETALIRATSKGRLEVVRRLLEAGADPNAEREDGFTALGVAVFFGYTDIVRALLAGGADPTAKGRLGATAEKWALFSGYNEIAELLKNHGSPGTRSSAGDGGGTTGKSAGPLFFPAEGTFSAVVPLSKLDESAALESVRGAGDTVEAVGHGLAPGREYESKDQDVVTVVRPRVRPSPASPPAHAVRRKVPRQPWPLTLLLLGLSVIAGLLAGTYLIRARWSAATQPTAPPVAEAAAEAEAGSQPPAPETAATTTDSQPPQPASGLPEPTPPTEPSAVASRATVPPAPEADSKPERVNGAKSASKPTPQPTAPENRRASKTEPAARSETNAPARAARPPTPTAAEKTRVRRAPSPAGRSAQRTSGRVTSASPRGTSPPVFSPTPSAKSSKSKVIQWP